MDEKSLYYVSLAISIIGLIGLSFLLPYNIPKKVFSGDVVSSIEGKIKLETRCNSLILIDEPIDVNSGDKIFVEGEERDGLIYPDSIFIRKNIINTSD